MAEENATSIETQDEVADSKKIQKFGTQVKKSTVIYPRSNKLPAYLEDMHFEMVINTIKESK
jgi:hypothetical protein